MSEPQRSLLFQPSFLRVWLSGLISWLGNGALFIALPVQVYNQTNSTLITALVVMAGALPGVMVGQFAGVVVDRSDYRRVLVLTNLALSLVTLGFLFTAQAAWWGFVLVSFVHSSVGQFLGPAEHALLPALVSPERLGEANGLNALNGNLARLLGPVLGGVLLTELGFAAVIVFDALTYLLAAGLLLGVVSSVAVRPPGRPAFLLEWRSGLEVVRSSFTLRLICLVAAVVGFGEGFVSTLMAPFVRSVLGGDGQTLGLIFSAQALGGLIGAWLVGRLADRWTALKLLAVGALGSGVLLLAYFNYALLYPSIWPAVLITALAGLPFAIFGTAQTLGLQRASPPELRGRVFSLCFGLVGLSQLVGMGVSGVLGERIGVLVINVDALTYLIAAGLAYSKWGRLGRGGRPAR
ncbi:MFS transporter [Deinococcus sp.]|uniref:MFS transporter n=1 Tax=Deinococcus sp. TaxID=47478 RepID=UPI0025FC6CFB|nr:MFS transporter [Deinococcus sp.]